MTVADDGSRDETPRVVEQFARGVGFPVRFTTEEHEGGRIARCRNRGIRASRGEYLLFVDGDCVLPPGHVRAHLDCRAAGVAQTGDSYRLGPEASERVAGGGGAGELARSVSPGERLRVLRNDLDGKLNGLLRNPAKPKLFSGDVGIWRRDVERVNGFDERFVGWGGEDDDLRARLVQAGVTMRSIRHRTVSYHLWHPVDATVSRRWNEGPNAARVLRRSRLTRCVDGLVTRRMEDLSVRFRGGDAFLRLAASAYPFPARPVPSGERADVEFLFLPGSEGFSGDADCSVLVLADRVTRPPLEKADVLVTDLADVRFDGRPRWRLSELGRVWESIL